MIRGKIGDVGKGLSSVRNQNSNYIMLMYSLHISRGGPLSRMGSKPKLTFIEFCCRWDICPIRTSVLVLTS